MMLGWMLYAVLLSALLGLFGLALERVLRLYGAPSRWGWVLALGGSVLAPVVAWVMPAAPAPVGATGPLAGVVTLEPLTVLGDAAAGVGLDLPLAVAWTLASLALAAHLALSIRGLGRRRRRWRPGEVDGVPVLVSRGTGPAVIGVLRGAIVVPEWALELDRRLRRLLLAHEREHLRAGDQRLLLAGVLAVVALPWNPVVWWQLRRLRLAIEVDCDARVLRGTTDARGYGALLVEVGRRHSSAPAPGAAFLFEPPSFLERRIRTMSRHEPRHRFAYAAAYAAAAVAVLAVACEAPAPNEADPTAVDPTAADVERAIVAEQATRADLEMRPTDEERRAAEPVFTPYEVAPELANRNEVMDALERFYPPLLKDAGIGGRVIVWFFIDENGQVVDTQIEESSGHEALDQAALKVARTMTFTPAVNRDERVKVWVAMPITFTADEAN